MTKASFLEATKGQCNSVREWNGLKIARVGWQENRGWKLVNDSSFEIVRQDSYRGIAEFRTRDQLWSYISASF